MAGQKREVLQVRRECMSDLHVDSPVQMLLPTHDPLSHNKGD